MDLFSTNVAYASVDSFVFSVNKVIINPIIIFIFALSFVYFLYGIFEFISNQENEEKKTTGKNHMLWGIIGIVVMMGVFQILGIIMNTFNIEGINPREGTVTLPKDNTAYPESF